MTVKTPFMPRYGANQKVSSGQATIDPMAQTVRVVNTGDGVVHVRIGFGTFAASESDTPVLGKSALLLKKQIGDDQIAVTGEVHVQTGEGCFQ
jgi:hypothetical protein